VFVSQLESCGDLGAANIGAGFDPTFDTKLSSNGYTDVIMAL